MNKEKFPIVMRTNVWFIVAFSILLPGPVYSQNLLFGAKVGGQITTTFANPAPPVVLDDRVVFGPTIEMPMKHGLSLQLDALYRPRVGLSAIPLSLPNQFIGDSRINVDVREHQWEIPLLLKWKISPLPVYLGAGLSGLNTGGTVHEFGFVPTGSGTFDEHISETQWTYGPVVEAGVDISLGSFHIQPELRYRRWQDPPSFGGFFATKPDEVQALIGIVFGKRSQ